MPPGYSSNQSKLMTDIRSNFPANMTYEEFYGIPDVITLPPGFEEKKVPVAKDPSPEPIKELKKTPEILKVQTEEDAWVTVKPKTRKKGASDVAVVKSNTSAQKFDSFAEMQMSSNKNKKKALKKKLKEIKDLLQKQSTGEKLNPQQLQKVQNKEKLEKELGALN